MPTSGGKVEATERIAHFLDTGKTYKEAIEAYYQILEESDRQFEYNTYIRDFFSDNQGKSYFAKKSNKMLKRY